MRSLWFAKPLPSWPIALALSLLLHGSIAVPLAFLPPGSGSTETEGRWLIDTRTTAPATEVHVVLCVPPSIPTGSTPVLPATTPAAAPAPPAQPQERTPHILSPHDSSGAGTAEEQEPIPPAQTRPRPSAFGAKGTDNGHETTAFFRIATQAKAIVYVVDRSGSMGVDGRLDTAKRELLKSLEHLTSSARFQVITYNRHAESLRIDGQYGLTFATAEHKRSVAHLLENIHAEGGTDHAGALKRALALSPEVIFFLTDADDLRADDILNISLLNHGRTVIHAIGFGRGGNGTLNILAQTNQGIYRTLMVDP